MGRHWFIRLSKNCPGGQVAVGEGVSVAVGGTGVDVGKRRVGVRVLVGTSVLLGVRVGLTVAVEVRIDAGERVGLGVIEPPPGTTVVANAWVAVGLSSVGVMVVVAVGRKPGPTPLNPHQASPNTNATTGINTQAHRRRSCNTNSGRVGERISVVAPPGEGGVGINGLTGREIRGPKMGFEMGGSDSACKVVNARAIIPAVAYRASGCLASAQARIELTSPGKANRSTSNGGGGSEICFRIISPVDTSSSP